MSGETVRQLAKTAKTPVDKLLKQLIDAGLPKRLADDPLSSDEKKQLLTHLRASRNSPRLTVSEGRKTTRRKSTSELRQTSGTIGRKKKTISVEVRKKRSYASPALVKSEPAPVSPATMDQPPSNHQDSQSTDTTEARDTAQLVIEEEARKKATAQAEKEMLQIGLAEAKAVRQQAEKEGRRQAEEARQKKDKEKVKVKKTNKKSGYGREQLHVTGVTSARRRKKQRPRSATITAQSQQAFEKPTAPQVREVAIPQIITVSELAQKMAVKASEVIKVMMNLGTMVTINQRIDRDTAAVVVEEIGHKVKMISDADIEQELIQTTQAEGLSMQPRPPVVTVMGHVDHGKTSLLDHIRSTRVIDSEAGGITQHIGAYHVETAKGMVTFLDTPGHAAFTAMRLRGAQITDVVVLVVAADDGVMPQTREAITHAKAAKTPLVVAINKIDLDNADPERVKNELSAESVIPEEWGGEDIFVNVCAKTGEGIDRLLDAILLQAEVLELQATTQGKASGIVIEASLDKGRGPVATILVQSGLLVKGDIILSGKEYGRVRALFDESGREIETAGPSMPAVVLGLSGIPEAGDNMMVVTDEKKAREVADFRHNKQREHELAVHKAKKLESAFVQMQSADLKTLCVLIKADVHGSAEALQDALQNLSNEIVKVQVVLSGVGGINESDAHLAMTSNALVIGFNVRADATARRIAAEGKLDIRYYSIIYEVIDDVKLAINGLLGSEVRETVVGLVLVKEVFRSSKFGTVAGCLVNQGVIRKANPVRVLRDHVVVHEGELDSLRRVKDDVDEVQSGIECGIGVQGYTDIRAGDQIEVFERIEVARKIS